MTLTAQTMRAIALSTALVIPGFAVAAGGGTTTPTPKPKPAAICLKKGEVFNKETKKCEKKEAVLDQDSLFESGREFAYAGQYEKAIEILSYAPDQLDARILNMKGFSHRKLGQIEKGMAYYKHSIAIDPQYALVREYYGEALLQIGDLAAAQEQLKQIKQICQSSDCEPYTQLHAAITDFEMGLTPEQRAPTDRW
ncbi:MAG: tetratricopeptide repeat protein [Salaquimonas sp.]